MSVTQTEVTMSEGQGHHQPHHEFSWCYGKPEVEGEEQNGPGLASSICFSLSV